MCVFATWKSFDVEFEGGFGGGGEGEGHDGAYAIKNQSPDVIVIRYAHARIHVSYRGAAYLLPLAPTDNKPDDMGADEWRADVQKGAVRDFIFKLTGTQPGHKVVDPASVPDNDSYDVKNGFWGQTVRVYLEDGVFQAGSTVEITLVPDGPLIDGSAGKTITRPIPLKEPGSYYYLYDLPLGTYTTTARLAVGGGAGVALHLREEVIDDPQPGSDTPQTAIKITWPSDPASHYVNTPLLRVSR